MVDRECATALVDKARREGIRRLAFEAHDVTVEGHQALAAVEGAPELVPLGHAVEALRVVKDESELAMLREACAIGDQALRETLDRTAPGQTEREVARRAGGRHGRARAPTASRSRPSWRRGRTARSRTTPRPAGEILRGDLLKIDFGALYGGYHSDCTRTVVVGREPEDWQREIYDVVRRAQRAGRAALAVDADVRDVDAAARKVVVDAGYGSQFTHGLGHGVGLEIHEAPLIGYLATGRLAARTPVTVEPGVYLPGRGGVRIEDTLVVGEGAPELLTTTPKDLLVL